MKIKVFAPKEANPFGFPHFELIHEGHNRVIPTGEVVEIELTRTRGTEWRNELNHGHDKLFAADEATAKWAGVKFDPSKLPSASAEASEEAAS